MRAEIMVVDDDIIARRLLSSLLTKQGYGVQTAESVDAAEALLARSTTEAFQAVVTDYRMPHRDGLQLLDTLQRIDPTLASVMVTAEGEKALMAKTMRVGALDFLEKPIQVGQFLSAVDRAVKKTFRRRELARANLAVQDVAAVQQSMLRIHAAHVGEAVRICVYPRQKAGGDFAAIYRIGERKFVVLTTDVSGHDVRAAFIGSYFQGIVRGMLQQGADVPAVFGFFNNFLAKDWNSREGFGHGFVDTSVAACAVTVDLAEGTLDVLDCGFPRPLYLNEEGQARWLAAESSSPLGWFAEEGYDQERSELSPRGTVSLWSDGLEDLAATLGTDVLSVAFRLQEARATKAPPPGFLESGRDDIIAVEISPTDFHAAGHVLIYQRYAGNSKPKIDEAQKFWERSLTLALPALGREPLFDILLCCREGLLNALIHGCRGDAKKEAGLQVTWYPAERYIRVLVDDEGEGFAPQSPSLYPGEPTNENRHRGLMLIRALATRVSHLRGGTILRIEFQIPAPADSL